MGDEGVIGSSLTVKTTWHPSNDYFFMIDASAATNLKTGIITGANLLAGNESGDVIIKNPVHGNDMLLKCENAGGTDLQLVTLDPDESTAGAVYLGAGKATGARFNLTNAGNTLYQTNYGHQWFSNTADGYNIVFYADTVGGVQKVMLTLDPDTQTANILGLKGASMTISADSDAVDVAGISIVYFDTTAGNITIGGFANGAADQIIWLVKSVAANTLTFEHEEATGTQKIRTSTAGDVAISNFCCRMAVFKTTYWHLSN